MQQRSIRLRLFLSLAWLVPAVCTAQPPDPRLTSHIDAIRIIDDHAHVVAPDMARDRNFDALPCDALPAEGAPTPANVRFGPDLQAAWKALYSFIGTSDAPDQIKAYEARQAAIRSKMGAGYYTWVLDRAGFDTVLANRIVMGPELSGPRFRWVPYDDALLFPLDNSAGKAASPDRKILFEAEERLLTASMSARGVSSRPASLDDYLTRVVTPTLEGQKREGALGIKFEAAYLRSLEFLPPIGRRRRRLTPLVYPERSTGSRTGNCRISCSATSPPRLAGSGSSCRFTPAADAAPTSTIGAAIRCCSIRC